ncbi:MAG: hypothetical protein LAT76_02020 [Schleiferiaceae bacterium]|nr:hypothetical protein [Schleiferiaceae bacterium]
MDNLSTNGGGKYLETHSGNESTGFNRHNVCYSEQYHREVNRLKMELLLETLQEELAQYKRAISTIINNQKK